MEITIVLTVKDKEYTASFISKSQNFRSRRYITSVMNAVDKERIDWQHIYVGTNCINKGTIHKKMKDAINDAIQKTIME